MKEYNKLSFRDRCLIEIGIDSRLNRSQIAIKIGKCRSVVNREIQRNGGLFLYNAEKAHALSLKSGKTDYSKINKDEEMQSYIRCKIKDGWSPQVIAGRWNLQNNHINISHESIYSWIYSNSIKKEKLFLHLPLRKKKRGRFIRKSIKNNVDKKLINTRPEEVNNRSRIGDWEIDLVFQQGNQSANFLTAIDRKTRFAQIIKNESKKSDDIALVVQRLQSEYDIKTITTDNGTEFSKYSEFKVDTYFCNPGSPWQKGAIEHFNGMIRRKIDYRTPMNSIDQKSIDKVVENLNNMPRKILGFLTPKEAINQSRVKLAQPAIEALQ